MYTYIVFRCIDLEYGIMTDCAQLGVTLEKRQNAYTRWHDRYLYLRMSFLIRYTSNNTEIWTVLGWEPHLKKGRACATDANTLKWYTALYVIGLYMWVCYFFESTLVSSMHVFSGILRITRNSGMHSDGSWTVGTAPRVNCYIYIHIFMHV